MAERSILNRTDDQLTSVVGYSGGNGGVGENGQVCYYTWNTFFGYYDALGHAEVVKLNVPKTSFKQFAAVYFDSFVDGNRKDVMDRGPEYRHVVGIPGGMYSDLF